MEDKYEVTAAVVFAVISAINFVILIAEGILELTQKGAKMPAGVAIFAGQLAKLIMAVSLAIWLFFALSDRAVTVIYMIVGFCAVVCLVSAALAVKAVIIEREMKIFIRVLYTVYALCSMFVFIFALYFLLIKFRV